MPLTSSFAGRTGGGAAGDMSGPHRGQGAFGLVPQAVNVPENIWSQVSRNLPDFGNLTGGTSSVIGSELAGTVSPQTQRALQTAAAQFGVSSGMPGSGLAANNYFGNIAGYSENRQRQGLQDYLATLQGVGATQTNPGLAYEVANRNAAYAAAPDPQAAAERMLAEYMLKFNMAKQAGSGGFNRDTGGLSDWQRQRILSGPEGQVGLANALATSGGFGGYGFGGTRGQSDARQFYNPGPDQVAYGPGGGPETGFAPQTPALGGFNYIPGQGYYGPGGFLGIGTRGGGGGSPYFYAGQPEGESQYYMPGGGPGGFGADTGEG